MCIRDRRGTLPTNPAAPRAWMRRSEGRNPAGLRPSWLYRCRSVAVAVTLAAGGGLLLDLLLDNERVRRQDHGGDRRGVAQCRTSDLDRVDDAGLDQIAVCAGLSVETVAGLELQDLGHRDVALEAGVLGDPAQRLGRGLAHDVRTRGLVADQSEIVEHRHGMDESGAATGDDGLFDGRASRRDGVLDTVLLLLELNLGVRADLDHADTAGKLGEALLELLAVPVRVGPLDLALDLVNATGKLVLVAGAVDNRRIVLGDHDAAGGTKVIELCRVELEADLCADDRAASENREVLQHRLAAVAEARRLDGDDLEDLANPVDHQGGQRFSVNVLGDDQQGLLGLSDPIQDREDVGHGRDLALGDQHVGVLQDGLHALGVGHEVRREVTLVELHALGELELGDRGLGLLDRDDTILADLVERLGDQATDDRVLCGQSCDLSDLFLALDLTCSLEQAGVDCLDGGVDAALERGRGGTGGNVAQTFLDHGLSQHGRGGRAVTGDVVGLGGDLLGELRTEVLIGVLELHLTGDRHAVVGDGRGAPLLVYDDVATLWACLLYTSP